MNKKYLRCFQSRRLFWCVVSAPERPLTEREPTFCWSFAAAAGSNSFAACPATRRRGRCFRCRGWASWHRRWRRLTTAARLVPWSQSVWAAKWGRRCESPVGEPLHPVKKSFNNEELLAKSTETDYVHVLCYVSTLIELSSWDFVQRSCWNLTDFIWARNTTPHRLVPKL